jgi:hypothetical protein
MCLSTPPKLERLTVEPEEMTVSSQWLIKYNPVAPNINATTEELMVMVFYMQST